MLCGDSRGRRAWRGVSSVGWGVLAAGSSAPSANATHGAGGGTRSGTGSHRLEWECGGGGGEGDLGRVLGSLVVGEAALTLSCSSRLKLRGQLG